VEEAHGKLLYRAPTDFDCVVDLGAEERKEEEQQRWHRCEERMRQPGIVATARKDGGGTSFLHMRMPSSSILRVSGGPLTS